MGPMGSLSLQNFDNNNSPVLNTRLEASILLRGPWDLVRIKKVIIGVISPLSGVILIITYL